MQKQNDRYRYAPSDLVEFMLSPFASWMTRFQFEHPHALTPDRETAEAVSLRERGTQHEQRVLAQLKAERRQVSEIPTVGDRARLTVEAMQAGQEIIHRGVLACDLFIGEADFLVRAEGPSTFGSYHYEVWDAKLAREPTPEFLIQLCCYADLLEALQGRRPETVRCVLGDRKSRAFRTQEYYYYYRALKKAFLACMERFDRNSPPLPDLKGRNGRWQTHAEAVLEASDHLCRVANITLAQMRRLQEAGIRTLRALAETERTSVPKMEAAVFTRLREQARLQVASAGAARPVYTLIAPESENPRKGFTLLPPASPLDVYFDMEGYPLAEGGLEYLFGATCVEGGKVRFFDWWAHTTDEEQRAFEGCIDWLYTRWRTDPCLHIYHYASYEVSALRRLMGRYGTRETELDALLRHDVFVDLYTIVRQSLRVGEPGYSIKNLERLYRDKRVGAVTNAGDAITCYERWLSSGESSDWRKSPSLRAIRDYNRDDCESTRQLAQWLRERQQEAGIDWIPQRTMELAEDRPLDGTPDQIAQRELADSLLGEIPADAIGRATDPQRWQVQEVLGHLVEFHRREEKPVWWAMFDRYAMTEEELIEDGDCLGGLRREQRKPVSIKHSLGFWYTFNPDQDTKLMPGSSCFFSHDLSMTTEVHALDRDRGRVCVKFGSKKLAHMAPQGPPQALSLIPREHVSARVIADAVANTALAWREEHHLPPALADFLLRRAPRFVRAEGALRASAKTLSDTAVRLVSGLDHSTLCIQGPPGSGKTTVAASIILALLAQGRRVGITSNSHAAILNLMQKCSALQAGRLACLKVGGAEGEPFFQQCEGAQFARSVREALPRLGSVGLVGGTAWTFSAREMHGKLDYLFVDEAGQVCLANLVGMAAAAKNLVLLGDQMQLGQPVQGSHPGESGLSILDYLLQGQATIPERVGLFLHTTWRLHPALCRFISETMYNGRLQAAPHTAKRVVRVPETGARYVKREAGIVFIPVVHEGNTYSSPEEVGVIQEIVAELVGRTLTDEAGRAAGPLRLEDILFVAPYNMQVRKLQMALGPHARVGSVDKFQGQEAPVVIVSLGASQGELSPRGIDFLFNRNRLNVALSRARSLAVVVANPALVLTPCSSIAQMALVNLFCRIVEEG